MTESPAVRVQLIAQAHASSLVEPPKKAFDAVDNISMSITELFPPVVPLAVATSVPALISHISAEIGIASTTLANLVHSESGGVIDAVGDGGCSYGLTQQNTCTTKVTKEEALDPEIALEIAANDIKKGTEYRYTSCNCYGFVKANFVPNLPKMAQIQPNSRARAGSVAIFYYSGVKHVAYVESVTEQGVNIRESNFTKCKVGRRFIDNDDPHLAGYWYK